MNRLTSGAPPHHGGLRPQAGRGDCHPRAQALRHRRSIRGGVANEHLDDAGARVLQLGRGGVRRRGKSYAFRVVLGKDTRSRATCWSRAHRERHSRTGARMLCGPMPTPAIAHSTVSMRRRGDVISASHNPYQDNGIKVFGPTASGLPDEAEHEIEQLMSDEALLGKRLHRPGIGRAEKLEDARGRTSCSSSRRSRGPVDGRRPRGRRRRARRGLLVALLVLQELGAQVTAIAEAERGEHHREAGALFTRTTCGPRW